MTTSMERRRSLCAGGSTAPENRNPSKPSICWWYTCAGTRGRSLTNARWVPGWGRPGCAPRGRLAPVAPSSYSKNQHRASWWVINSGGWERGEEGRIRERTQTADLWEILEGSVLDPPCPAWWPEDHVLWRRDWPSKELILVNFI